MDIKKALLLLFCFSFPAVHAQSYLKLYDLIDQRQHKSLEKALEKIPKAGNIMQQANIYYTDAAGLQSNYNVEDKEIEKRLAEAEKNAITTHLKADKIYSEAYSEIFDICDKEFESGDLSKGLDLREKSHLFMDEAALKRHEAGNFPNPYQKAELLNEAESIEAEAIETIIMALEVNHGIEPQNEPREESYIPDQTSMNNYQTDQAELEIPIYNHDVISKNENLSIDMAAVQRYNNYLNDNTISDPITITSNGITGIEDPTIETARNYLHAYEYGAAISENTSYGVTENQEITELVTAEEKPTDETGNDPLLRDEVVESTESVRDPVDATVHFMIQIAASRIPLTRAQLWGIYPGNYSVEVMEENNWFKYRITGFRLYTDAALVAEQLDISGVWVVAIQNGSNIALAEAWSLTKKMESDVKEYGRDALPGEIDYYVQVAASKTRIMGQKRQALCAGSIACREIIEEGWFKYQIPAKSDYQLALDIQKQLEGKSFVVAYQRGLKLKQDRP